MNNYAIDGMYKIIPVSSFGYSMEDLGFNIYDVLCWDPRMYIDNNCQISINDAVKCTVKVMSRKKYSIRLGELLFTYSMSFIEMLDILRSMSIYPFFICSDEVANELKLPHDGYECYIKEENNNDQ